MQRNQTIRYLAFVCCLLLLLSWTPVTARAEIVIADDSSYELQEEIDKLQNQEEALRKKLDKLESQLLANTEAIADAVEQKDILDQQIVLLNNRINNANDQIAGYTALIADKQAELDNVLIQQSELQ